MKSDPKDQGSNLKCGVCDRTFNINFYLRKHFEDMHNSIERLGYQCNFCGKTCSTDGNLKRHIGLMHETGKRPM